MCLGCIHLVEFPLSMHEELDGLGTQNHIDYVMEHTCKTNTQEVGRQGHQNFKTFRADI